VHGVLGAPPGGVNNSNNGVMNPAVVANNNKIVGRIGNQWANNSNTVIAQAQVQNAQVQNRPMMMMMNNNNNNNNNSTMMGGQMNNNNNNNNDNMALNQMVMPQKNNNAPNNNMNNNGGESFDDLMAMLANG